MVIQAVSPCAKANNIESPPLIEIGFARWLPFANVVSEKFELMMANEELSVASGNDQFAVISQICRSLSAKAIRLRPVHIVIKSAGRFGPASAGIAFARNAQISIHAVPPNRVKSMTVDCPPYQIGQLAE